MKILTFDLEDWFHILDFPATASPASWETRESRVEKNTERILELLDERQQKATWFCLGWIADKYPGLIKKIASSHEIAYHSSDHRLLYETQAKDVKADLENNLRRLEDLSGKRITAYRAPGFSFTRDTKWLVNVLSESGIHYDCSIFPARRNHGGYPEFPATAPCILSYTNSMVKEFPMTYSNVAGRKIVCSGGGYFRLMPYAVLSRLISRQDYVMTYFHPRDFDPDQPVLDGLSWKRKYMSYVGLKKSFSRLKRLLNEYKFVSVEDAARNIDWGKAPIINLENY